jgi:transketolase
MKIDKAKTKSIRNAYGKTLVELGKENNDIVVLDADLACSTQTAMFGKEFPERFFNMGIAEQDMMATAAGLASQGKIPFASTFAMFATGRTYDQIRNSICYPKFNVKIVATHGGVTVGEDGASHQALEDVSLMRNIPDMTVIVPADCKECEEVIKYAAHHKGPMYIRLARTNVPDIFDENYKFDLKAKVLRDGRDVTIVTNGETLAEVIECADILEKSGIDAQILHIPVVKPLDNDTILEEIKKTNFIVTVENHSIIGGLGSAISELLSENMPVFLYRIGINDEFGQSGEQRSLMDFYGLTAEKLAQKIEKKLRKIK